MKKALEGHEFACVVASMEPRKRTEKERHRRSCRSALHKPKARSANTVSPRFFLRRALQERTGTPRYLDTFLRPAAVQQPSEK